MTYFRLMTHNPTPTVSHDFHVMTHMPNFPTALRHCYPPIKALFGRGSPELLMRQDRSPGLAIVGSRQATAQGIADAAYFARVVSEAGLTIISGLAQGIDAAAHRGALGGAGKTIAVLGHGRDSIYPQSHLGLAQEIIEAGGTLVSEYPDGMPARRHHFPCRNRIIAGLSRAVLVVEAAPQSGSLITARHALDIGVDVFVVPGSIHQPQSMGSNQLIRQGAQLVQSPHELLADLGVNSPANTAPSTDQAEQMSLQDHADSRARVLMTHLSFHPITVHQLESASQMPEGDIYAGLLLLELSQQARRTPDGKWLKVSTK